MTRSTCGSLWYESVENAPEDFWEVVSRGETSSARDEEEKNKDQNKGQRKKREETNAPETVCSVFCRRRSKERRKQKKNGKKKKGLSRLFSIEKIEKQKNSHLASFETSSRWTSS